MLLITNSQIYRTENAIQFYGSTNIGVLERLIEILVLKKMIPVINLSIGLFFIAGSSSHSFKLRSQIPATKKASNQITKKMNQTEKSINS